MFAETANLIARLLLKDDFSKPMGKASKAVTGLGKSLGKAGKVAAVGVGAAVGAASIIIQRNVNAGLESLATLEDATTSVSGAITQRGLQKALNSADIAKWANEIEASIDAAFDDKDIVQATGTLIRFGKIAPANLRPAMAVMTDLAAKTGSVESAATLLAKALADPINAAGKLARAGVILTDQQKEQLASFGKLGKEEQKHFDQLNKEDPKAAKRYRQMVLNGKAVKAQAFLLTELEKVTKGAADAMNGEFRDSQLVLGDVVEDAQRALAIGFIPLLKEVRGELATALADPATLEKIKGFGETLAGGLRGAIDIAKGLPWQQIGDSLALGGKGAKIILDTLTGMPDWVKTAVLTGWGLNKVTGGALSGLVGSGIEVAFKQFAGRGASPANPLFVKDVALPGVGGKGGAVVPAAAGGAAAAGGGAAAGLLGTAGILGGFVAVGESLATLPGSFDSFERGMDAVSNKDLPGARQALQDFRDGLPTLNPFVTPTTALLDMVLKEWPPEPLKVSPQGMSPDERQERSESIRKMGAVGDSVTRSGQNTRAAVERTQLKPSEVLDAFNRSQMAQTVLESKDVFTAARDKIEAARIAINTSRTSVVSSAHSDTDRIVNAIHNIKLKAPAVQVFVDKGDAGNRSRGGQQLGNSRQPFGPGHGA